MPITSVKEQGHQRTASVSVASNGNTVTDSARIFLVVSDTGLVSDLVILNAIDPNGGDAIPSLFAAHPYMPWISCSGKSIRWMATDGRAAEVLCNYSFVPPFRLPWEQMPIYSWDSNDVDQIVDVDLATGKTIRNSAKQVFDPAVTAPRLDAVLTVVRNELTPVDASQWNGCVNSAAFKGAAPNYCRVKIAQAEQIYVDDTTGAQTPYRQSTYNFAFKNPGYPGWQAKVMDAGFCKLVGGVLQPIVIGFRESSTPVPLDGSGAPLAPSADPVYLDFTTMPSQDFNSLGL